MIIILVTGFSKNFRDHYIGNGISSYLMINMTNSWSLSKFHHATSFEPSMSSRDACGKKREEVCIISPKTYILHRCLVKISNVQRRKYPLLNVFCWHFKTFANHNVCFWTYIWNTWYFGVKKKTVLFFWLETFKRVLTRLSAFDLF